MIFSPTDRSRVERERENAPVLDDADMERAHELSESAIRFLMGAPKGSRF